MITVITVCYNAEQCIIPTIESILKQNTGEFEYIIKDGNSKDGTNNIIEEYKSRLDNKLSSFMWIKESDSGLYNAMNVASKLAHGQYLLFINAGDQLYNENVISLLSTRIGDYDIYYGDVINQTKDGKQSLIEVTEAPEYLKKGMFFCHQAALIRRNVMISLEYAEKYQICADYDFFLRSYLQKCTFCYIKLPIAIFEIGGISYTRAFDLIDEAYRIQLENGVQNKWKILLLRLKNLCKKKVIAIAPPRLLSLYKSFKNKTR